MERTYLHIILILSILVLSSCGGGSVSDVSASDSDPNPSTSLSDATVVQCEPDNPQNNAECLLISLPCIRDRWGWYGQACRNEEIKIPRGRPIYAFLVSGFQQNNNLDMFHFYNFAKCLQAKGAYIHYAWWNNLLAPYMEKPLHNEISTSGARSILDYRTFHDYNIWPYNQSVSGFYPTKAVPAEDYQFQQDAEAVLKAIKEDKPDAKIILVGHSMGGDAIARLASNTSVEIALVAPIDPVGNRTCLPLYESELNSPGDMTYRNTRCHGAFNFTRFMATHEDWYERPRGRSFVNVSYLYHQWQEETFFPLDYGCPSGGPLGILCPTYTHMIPGEVDRYLFGHPDTHKPNIDQDSTNVQSVVSTSHNSYLDVNDLRWGGGSADGHGEIVGFRGLYALESWPLALTAQGNWPNKLDTGPNRIQERIDHMKAWEKDPNYIYKKGHEPYNPGLCMVSRDLCNVLAQIVPDTTENSPPVANAGSDQIVECTDPAETKVFLNGSGSTDPDGTIDRFDWNWTGNSATGEEIFAYLPLGTHLFTLTVTDNGGLTDTDTVDVTVQDTTAPTLSVTLSPNVLSPSNHKMVTITATIQINDSCDDSPTIKLVSITSNEADNGLGDGDTSNDIQGAEFGTDDREFLLRAERSGKGIGRIYTVTYSATDSSGNVTYATAEVTIPHDHGKSK